MTRKLICATALAGLILCAASCVDEKAREDINSNQSQLDKMRQQIQDMDNQIKKMDNTVSGMHYEPTNVAQIQEKLENVISTRMLEIKNSQTNLLNEQIKKLNELSEQIQKNSKDDSEAIKKLAEGQLYTENIRTEMETYFKGAIEKTMETMIDSKLSEVYPYIYLNKRY